VKPSALVTTKVVPLLVLLLLVVVALSSHLLLQAQVNDNRMQCEGTNLDRVAIINEQWASVQSSPIIGRGEDATQLAARAKVRGYSRKLAVTLSHRVESLDAKELPVPLRRYATFSCAREFPEPSWWP
jgi:hypothetical protein